MLETSRRSAISTSELGLYSDRSDRYNRSRYGLIARKCAIGVMVVVTVILVSIIKKTSIIIFVNNIINNIIINKYFKM